MSKKILIALAALLAASTLAPTASSGPASVTLTFLADGEKATFWGYEPTSAACTVTVPAGADGSAVFEAALAEGCITEWSYSTYEGARFLSSINGVAGETLDPFCLTVCGYWQFFVDGESASYGLDSYHAVDGATFEWRYTNANAWLALELP